MIKQRSGTADNCRRNPVCLSDRFDQIRSQMAQGDKASDMAVPRPDRVGDIRYRNAGNPLIYEAPVILPSDYPAAVRSQRDQNRIPRTLSIFPGSIMQILELGAK